MKNFRFLFVALMSVVCLLGFSSCEKDDDDGPLVGKWYYGDNFYKMTTSWQILDFVNNTQFKYILYGWDEEDDFDDLLNGVTPLKYVAREIKEGTYTYQNNMLVLSYSDGGVTSYTVTSVSSTALVVVSNGGDIINMSTKFTPNVGVDYTIEPY